MVKFKPPCNSLGVAVEIEVAATESRRNAPPRLDKVAAGMTTASKALIFPCGFAKLHATRDKADSSPRCCPLCI
jgi:hypothetical protein